MYQRVHGSETKNLCPGQLCDCGIISNHDETSAAQSGDVCEPRANARDGGLDMPLSKRNARPDVDRPTTTGNGAGQSIDIDRSGTGRDPACRHRHLERAGQNGSLPSHGPQPVRGDRRPELAFVPDHDAGAAYGQPMVGGLYELAARRLGGSGYGGTVVFLAGADIEQEERTRGIRSPDCKCCRIDPRNPVATAKRCSARKGAGAHFRRDAGGKNPLRTAFAGKPREFPTLGAVLQGEDRLPHAQGTERFRPDDAARPSGAVHDDRGFRAQPFRKAQSQFGIGAAQGAGNGEPAMLGLRAAIETQDRPSWLSHLYGCCNRNPQCTEGFLHDFAR